MRLDLTPLLNGRLRKLDFSFDFSPDSVPDSATLPDYIRLTSPVRVDATVTRSEAFMGLRAHVTAEYDTECDRCLDTLHRTVSFDMERIVAMDGDIGEDSGDDVVFVNDCFLDFDRDIAEELVLEMPAYHLCRDDCPGLCPKCGKKLADGDCGCSKEKEIDPRLANLQKLLDNFD